MINRSNQSAACARWGLALLALLALLAGCGAGMGDASPTEPAGAAVPSATMVVASATPRPATPTMAEPTATAEPAVEPSATAEESSSHSGHVMGETVAMPIKLFQFKPEVLEVAVGTTVAWTNEDDIQHSVTHGTPEAKGAAFDSGFFTLGQTFSHTFDEPGEYPYFCMRHPSMLGTVKVQ